jgi:C4-dicarboxylate transporter, DctM subunit
MPPLLIVILILLALIPLGMFLETMSIMVIFVPLLHPAVVQLGYEGIWFAILFVIMIELGLITPPVGMNVFVVSMTARVKLEAAFAGALPFCLVILGAIAILLAFPDIVMWLPSLIAK